MREGMGTPAVWGCEIWHDDVQVQQGDYQHDLSHCLAKAQTMLACSCHGRIEQCCPACLKHKEAQK